MKPLVSIIFISFNQEKYVKQALEGFLMQKVNFTYEIIVHDDASTDGTQKVIQECINKNPNIFRPILETENQFSKTDAKFLIDMYRMAKGKYVAVCEGDDYWSDDTKLQRQVDFLENNPDYSVVFHPVNVHFENQSIPDVSFPENKRNLTLDRLLEENFIQTNSVMYRAAKSYQNCETDVLPTDWYMHLYHAQYGKIGFINRTMAVYRRHKGGLWWDSVNGEAAFFKRIFQKHMKLFSAVKSMYGSNETYALKIYEAESKFVKNAVSLNLNDVTFLQDASKLSPNVMGQIMYDLNHMKLAEEARKKELENELQQNKERYLDLIESRSYRIGRAVTKPLRIGKKVLKRS